MSLYAPQPNDEAAAYWEGYRDGYEDGLADRRAGEPDPPEALPWSPLPAGPDYPAEVAP